ncbi:MAG: 23S rRNA (adenine(2503)-C(2))-methyltransferase RlmN [Ignavibacteria bacterium]|nr:23S rRNA (adenine(2503)-C(2))-methyltransferase RlmN [Ignavibacteria bacterium]
MEKEVLKGLSLPELQEFVTSFGQRTYRAEQLFSWMYARGAQSFDEMSNISKEFRTLLAGRADLNCLRVETRRVSQIDRTTKFLFRLNDGLKIESVLIPTDESAPHFVSMEKGGESPGAEKRLTLCISTQVGCPLDCKFCATGTMGFFRNLTAGEIIDQVISIQRLSDRRITNIVYMGMGEPMLNYNNVMKSIEILTASNSMAIGHRHITVSTAGYAARIRQLGDEQRKFKLALSLHSLDEEKRTALMPITKKFGVKALLESLEYYYRRTKRRPTFEYILFKGFNDSAEDVQKLAAASRRVPCKVNLIPFHSIDFTAPEGFARTLKPASPEEVEMFAKKLRERNITVMVRGSMGEDIEAACGQLAVAEK